MNSYIEHPSPLGKLLLAANGNGLCGVYFEQHKYFNGPGDWRREPGHSLLTEAARQLDEYFAGRRARFDIALDLPGTPFQQAVWRALQTLPFGVTASYQTIAQRVAKPKAIRAAGTAIGRNPISIIVPCHRVLGASGTLSGYAGGLERKQFLLELELANANEDAKRSTAPHSS